MKNKVHCVIYNRDVYFLDQMTFCNIQTEYLDKSDIAEYPQIFVSNLKTYDRLKDKYEVCNTCFEAYKYYKVFK